MWGRWGIIGNVVVSAWQYIERPVPIANFVNLCQPFTTYFPCANIHELMSPDILHQLVKECFKDHLVTWVVEYLEQQEDGKLLVAEMD